VTGDAHGPSVGPGDGCPDLLDERALAASLAGPAANDEDVWAMD